MAVTSEAHSAIAIAPAGGRARDGLAQIVQRFLAANEKDVVGAVSAVLELAEEIGQLRVGCREDGTAFTVRVGREPEHLVELPNARSLVRMMCANLAVRSTLPNQLPLLYGGVAYLPPLECGRAGYTLKLMNTMGEHWFDIAHQGKDNPLTRRVSDGASASSPGMETARLNATIK